MATPEAPASSNGRPTRVAVLCCLPDAGHALPLIQVGFVARALGWNVQFFLPDETATFAIDRAFEVQNLGPALSARSKEVLRDHYATPPRRRALRTYPRYVRAHLIPEIANIWSAERGLRASIRAARPDVVVADDHRLRHLYRSIAADLAVPLVLNDSSGAAIVSDELEAIRQRFAAAPGRGRGVLRRLGLAASTIRRPGEASRSWRMARRSRLAARRTWQSRLAVPYAHISPGLGLLECTSRPGAHAPDQVRLLGPLPPLASANGIDPELEDWLSIRRVIYVSFGSVVRPSDRFLAALRAAARRLGSSVLWASTFEPDLTGVDGRWMRWAPQVELLAHPSVAAFVTHCGSGSLRESLWMGTPVVAVPVVNDQFHNALTVEALGVGTTIDHFDTDRRRVEQALRTTLSQEVAARAREVSVQLRQQQGAKHLANILQSALATRGPLPIEARP